MNGSERRRYRFASAAQWRRALLQGFEVGKGGGVKPRQQLGRVPFRVPGTGGGSISRVALEHAGSVIWREDAASGAQPSLFLMDLDEVRGPFDVDATLARAARWVPGRAWLWSLSCGATRLDRFDAESLEHSLVIDSSELAERYLGAQASTLTLVDVTSDGRDGLWALVRWNGDHCGLLHVDCRACRAGFWGLPCEVANPLQVAAIDGGQTLAVLCGGGKSLALVSVEDGTVVRQLSLAGDDPCFSGRVLATNAKQRMAVLGDRTSTPGATWSVLLLDASGDVLETFPGTGRAELPDAFGSQPLDIAVERDALWFGTRAGLYRLDSSDKSGARESESVLVTPLLISPESERGRGFSRAELDIDLPRGAVLEARVATTNDDQVAAAAAAAIADLRASSARRQANLWALLDERPGAPFMIVGPSVPGQPVAIPLLTSRERYLALEIRIVTPPDSAPAELRELRVLYPNLSIAAQLPAIFTDERTDAAGFMRRLLGVIETTTQGLDDLIARLGSFVDPDTAPPAWFDYLARWLGLPWDDALPDVAKRRLLAVAGKLLDQRGTRAGLGVLLEALLGDGGTATVADLTVDAPPLRLGGAGGRGSALPGLLAGASRRLAILGKAQVGGARLACNADAADPLRELVERVKVEVMATRETSRALSSLARSILAQYLPAGVRLTLDWTAARQLGPGDGTLVLDAPGPAGLGDDSVIGRIVLGGHGSNRLDAGGVRLGIRLG